MQKTLRTFILLSLIFIFTKCTSQGFSQEEKDFTNKIASLLGNATVTLKKGVATNEEEGTFKKAQIDIANLKVNPDTEETDLLFASSIPAYLFTKAGLGDQAKYKYVDIRIDFGETELTNRYSAEQLRQVIDCESTFSGFMSGLKEANKDSLVFYGSDSLFNNNNLESLLDILKNANIEYGAAEEGIFKGFAFDTTLVGSRIIFSGYLVRAKGNNRVDLMIDAKSKKVIIYDL